MQAFLWKYKVDLDSFNYVTIENFTGGTCHLGEKSKLPSWKPEVDNRCR